MRRRYGVWSLEALNRHLSVSDALWLEVMLHATFHHQEAERRYC